MDQILVFAETLLIVVTFSWATLTLLNILDYLALTQNWDYLMANIRELSDSHLLQGISVDFWLYSSWIASVHFEVTVVCSTVVYYKLLHTQTDEVFSHFPFDSFYQLLLNLGILLSKFSKDLVGENNLLVANYIKQALGFQQVCIVRLSN